MLDDKSDPKQKGKNAKLDFKKKKPADCYDFRFKYKTEIC